MSFLKGSGLILSRVVSQVDGPIATLPLRMVGERHFLRPPPRSTGVSLSMEGVPVHMSTKCMASVLKITFHMAEQAW